MTAAGGGRRQERMNWGSGGTKLSEGEQRGMARKRMIDPDFWTDEKLGECNRDERLFFMGLISNADDEGRGRGNIKLLKATIFPYDDDLKVKDIEKMACSLMGKGMAIFYVFDGQDFYCLPNFPKHQVINKPTESKLPSLPDNEQEILLPEYYRSNTVELPPKRKEEKIKEKKEKEEKKPRAQFVTMTDKEYQSLIDKFGEQSTLRKIDNLSLYKGSKGVKYESDYLTILAWDRRDNERPTIPQGNHIAQSKLNLVDQFFGLEDTGSG